MKTKLASSARGSEDSTPGSILKEGWTAGVPSLACGVNKNKARGGVLGTPGRSAGEPTHDHVTRPEPANLTHDRVSRLGASAYLGFWPWWIFSRSFSRSL